HENQRVCNWAVALSGEDDPPVLVESDSSPNVLWQPFADTFSEFINTAVSDWLGYTFMLCAQDIELTDRSLNHLRRYFVEGHVTHSWPGKDNYRFSLPDQYILIWNSEGQADWRLQANSIERLEELCNKVWECGNLSTTLYAHEREGENVLNNKRIGSN
ncbi:MAG: hypothetical protein K2X81_22745, partial [Candidatus Obscuribacterales bacterium]|nr:hypothetical protein [Candidatus Obscuribacterales bacterium]